MQSAACKNYFVSTGLARAAGLTLAIGLWGGIDREFTNDTDHFDPPRFFSLRSNERVQPMLAPFGEVESFESWPNVHSDWCYQFIVLRV